MDVIMHNVGFGDCFELSADTHRLLVDCGTVSYRKNRRQPASFRKFVREKIIWSIEHSNGIRYDALITHFDKDHYCGFQQMVQEGKKDIFDCVYVPYLLLQDSSTKSYFMLDELIGSYLIYADDSPYFKLAKEALEHIKALKPLCRGNKIRRLCYGQSFALGDERFDVLWPDPVYPYLNFLDEESGRDRAYGRTAAEIIKNVKQAISDVSEPKVSFEELEDAKQAFVDILSRWYDFEGEGRLSEEEVQKTKEQLENAMERLDKMRRSFLAGDFYYVRRFSSLGKLLIKTKNATSIVFHDRCRRILMTGDITAGIIEAVLYKRFAPGYSVVKVPHHGTHSRNGAEARHYSPCLPRACSLLISSGWHSWYNPISVYYPCHPCLRGMRYCSAGGNYCEIRGHQKGNNKFDNGRRCYRHSCNNDWVSISL